MNLSKIRQFLNLIFPIVSIFTNVTGSPSSAQEMSHPNEAQIQEGIAQILQIEPQVLQSLTYLNLQRTSEENELRSFVEAWSKVNPSITPFLGEWGSRTYSVAVYPSRTPGQICVLTHGDHIRFDVTSITADNQFQVNRNYRNTSTSFRNASFVRNGNYLIWVRVTDQGVNAFPSFLPQPLRNPLEFLTPSRESSNLIRRFNAAGCTFSLPDDDLEPVALPPRLINLSLNSAQTINNVALRLNGGYESNTSNVSTFDFYLTIENRSNRPFGFMPWSVKVVDSNGQEIGSQYDSDTDINYADPGGVLTGRVIVSRPYRTLESSPLFLIVPQGTGEREFRIPIE